MVLQLPRILWSLTREKRDTTVSKMVSLITLNLDNVELLSELSLRPSAVVDLCTGFILVKMSPAGRTKESLFGYVPLIPINCT